MGARQPHALVELHLDVGPEEGAALPSNLGRQLMARSIDMRLESYAALAELAQFRKAHHLKAPGIGEDGMGPVHECVQAPERPDPLGSRRQHQMIGVGKHDVVAKRPHRIRMHGLDGRGGADRHEGRRADHAARGRDCAGPRSAVRGVDGEGKIVAHGLPGPARVRRQASPNE